MYFCCLIHPFLNISHRTFDCLFLLLQHSSVVYYRSLLLGRAHLTFSLHSVSLITTGCTLINPRLPDMYDEVVWLEDLGSEEVILFNRCYK